MRARRWLRSVLATTALAALAIAPLRAAPPVGEYELKAAFIYNFALFTTWPPDAAAEQEASFNLCFYGDRFGPVLDGLEEKTIRNRPVRVRRMNALEQVQSCHLLFIGEGRRSRLAEITASLRHLSVLTVADTPGALRAGVMINLEVLDRRMTFEINATAASRARLAISSRLLKLAQGVY